MNKLDVEIEKVLSNWNTDHKEKGDGLFKLAKESINDSDIYKCLSLAKIEYEKARLDGDTKCFCNLADCYYVLAYFSYNSQHFEEAKNYYLKSVEFHISGSRGVNYQFKSFYRFYSVSDEKTAGSILSKIMLSSPKKFNDPVDCPIVQENSSKFFFPDKTIFEGIKVCCFGQENVKSEKDEVPFQIDAKKWAYYADKHQGICIRYRFLPFELEKVLSNNFVFSPVEYKSQFSFERGIVADGLLSKSDHYQDEDEWRIIWFDRDYKNNKYYDKDRDCLLVPIDICNIISIYLGYRCHDKIVSTVIDYVKSQKNMKIPIFRINPDPDNLFRMKETRIY